ncbi:MAG: hypothetical protein ACJ76X_05580 [Solirubrobacteraceae bacterium]
MLQRVAARLLTGPIAFFLAGVIDIGEFVVLSLWARARRRWRGR